MNSQIALVDWDGTISKGFTINRWSAFLVNLYGSRNGIVLTEEIQRMMNDYRDSLLSHDQLAERTAITYAQYIQNISRGELQKIASEFVLEDSKHLFKFSKGLFDFFRDCNITPIIVSGAPLCILECYKKEFGLIEIYGMDVVFQNEVYSSEVRFNPGISSLKKKVVEQLPILTDKVLVAFGDSNSDIPLFRKANLNIVVGSSKISKNDIPSSNFYIVEDETIALEDISLIISQWVNCE